MKFSLSNDFLFFFLFVAVVAVAVDGKTGFFCLLSLIDILLLRTLQYLAKFSFLFLNDTDGLTLIHYFFLKFSALLFTYSHEIYLSYIHIFKILLLLGSLLSSLNNLMACKKRTVEQNTIDRHGFLQILIISYVTILSTFTCAIH